MKPKKRQTAPKSECRGQIVSQLFSGRLAKMLSDVTKGLAYSHASETLVVLES